MAYKIIDVEGIGPVYAEKLQAVGLKTTEEYLEKCATPAGRKALAEETDISPKLILKWANHADLFRINGIASQFAELLEAAGVDTVKARSPRCSTSRCSCPLSWPTSSTPGAPSMPRSSTKTTFTTTTLTKNNPSPMAGDYFSRMMSRYSS